MQLIDELVAEHALIEQVAGSFRTYARGRVRGEGEVGDGVRFLTFFRLYAGQFHHAREEDTLFVSLQRDAELPGDRGPIAALLGDHHRMAGILAALDPLVAAATLDDDERALFLAHALSYTEQLWHHIDAENSVLFPESDARLLRHGVAELPTRAMTADEADARALGERLVATYPPVHEPAIIRGDGCVLCPAMLDTCEGLERAWWNEWEWEEFEDHLPSG